jgi:hypothetical protein
MRSAKDAEVGDGGRNGLAGRAVPGLLIAEGLGDHAEGLDLGAARLAGRKVPVGGGAVGFDQGDEGFVGVVALDHVLHHHFVTAVMLR